ASRRASATTVWESTQPASTTWTARTTVGSGAGEGRGNVGAFMVAEDGGEPLPIKSPPEELAGRIRKMVQAALEGGRGLHLSVARGRRSGAGAAGRARAGAAGVANVIPVDELPVTELRALGRDEEFVRLYEVRSAAYTRLITASGCGWRGDRLVPPPAAPDE